MKSTMAKGHNQPPAEHVIGMLSPESFATYFDLHPEYIRDRIRNGEIRAQKLGRHWRIPLAERNRIETQGINSRSRKAAVAA